MLDNILKIDSVTKLIYEIENNARYYDKKSDKSVTHQLYVGKEQALFVVYDALLKYKIILDDNQYLDEFIEQLEKLFKKLDNFNDICLGVNRLIGSICITKLHIKDVDNEKNRELILKYIYDKYIINGYLVHGYSSCYEESIKNNGFIPDVYENNYSDFKNINNIFAKYNVYNILDKNFENKEVRFTDNFIMGCYYSVNAPGYLYRLLCDSDHTTLRIKKDAYLRNDYNSCISNLKKLFFVLEVSEHDKKYILDIVKKEWDFLHKEKRRISLMLVKRSMFEELNSINIGALINDKNISYLEAVDSILNYKNTNVLCDFAISKDDIIFVSLDGIKEEDKGNVVEQEINNKQEIIMTEFQNVYGRVSALLLIGSMLITLGVIITIFMFFGG